MNRKSYVYVAQCGDFVKIGFSIYPVDRVTKVTKRHQTICPEEIIERPVVLLVVVHGSDVEEKKLHLALASYRDHRRMVFIVLPVFSGVHSVP